MKERVVIEKNAFHHWIDGWLHNMKIKNEVDKSANTLGAFLSTSQTKYRLFAVLPGPDKHSQPHSPKTTAIFEDFTATYQKICAAWYFKAQQQ